MALPEMLIVSHLGNKFLVQLISRSRQHNNFFITANNRTTCFDRSLSHLQVLNMLQVLVSCAHIWDPNSVYNEAIHWRRQ